MKAKVIIEAITAAQGNVSTAARNLGKSRQDLYHYINKDPRIKAALEEARETMLDDAESVLSKCVREGEGWAVCFYLKTQGKKRGYIERQEVSGPEGGRIIIELDRGSESKSATESVPVSNVPV